MRAIARTLKAIVLPHFPSRAEKAFIQENRHRWNTRRTARPAHTAPRVLVETALSTPASLLEKFLIAKLIEDQTGSTSIALLNSFYQRASEAYGVARSFGIFQFVCGWRGYANPLLAIQCLAKTLSIIRHTRTGERLLDLRLDGIHVGDLLYDTLIRYRPNCYTVGQLDIGQHFRLIYRAIFNFHKSRQLFNTHNIIAFVTSHTVYAEFGIICRVAHSHGATVYLKDMDVFRVYGRNDNIYEHFLKISQQGLAEGLASPEVVANAERYFERRLGGDVDQIDLKNAYTEKRLYEREEFLDLFGANNGKKNVCVLSHAFSDAPHVGGKLAFEDYYVWLRETLLTLSKNTAVNVFVKPHPSSYMWGEKGAVETLLTDIGVSNIFITPKDINTLSLKNIADYIVTARGTAGLEYSGFGIPAITCGEGYYSSFDVAHENLSREGYVALLSNITSLPPLPPATMVKARVLLYLTFAQLARSSIAPARHIYPGDDSKRIIPLQYQEITEKLRSRETYEDSFTKVVSKAISDAL